MDRIRELLSRVTDLSDQELNELRDLVLEQFQETDSDAGDAPDSDSLALLRELANASTLVNTEITSRNESRRERAELVSQGTAIATLADEPTPEGGDGAAADGAAADGAAAEGSDGGGEGEDPAVTAAAEGDIKPPEDRRPAVRTSPAVVTAAADIPGVQLGHEFENEIDVARAMTRRIETLKHSRGGDGEQVVVASIQSHWDDGRTLHPNQGEENFEKVRAVTAGAVTAAGGLCAPVDTRYDLFGAGVTDRPVRDSLVRFAADRGGIRFITPPTVADLAGAVGVWTVQNDANAVASGGPRKVTARIGCGAEVVVNTQAITLSLTFGNMQARAYPELVARHTDLAMVAQARVAEQQLLAQIGALSKQVTTGAQVVGAARHLLGWVDRALASYRNRHRLGGFTMRAIFPQWFRDELRADLAMQHPGDGLEVLMLADTLIDQWFAARNCVPVWALDGEAGQDYGAQADASPIQGFPANVIWYLFAEGTFLHLDGGTLDLGIVRDSTLNSTNDYQTFAETFEAVARIGHEGLRVTSAIAPHGAGAADVAT